MPRVRLFLLPVLCLLLVMCWIERVAADCWYNSKKYKEGSEVTTEEPCLNCTCNKGTPVCYLRVCPRLPNAPPRGCILLHKFKACCPELVCEDRPSIRNGIEARSDPNDFDAFDTTLERGISFEHNTCTRTACVSKGSIYSPGSAMDSSRFCEYCYCLRGQQHCIKPKCLLAIEGCEPKYSPHSCCPIYYNCTYSITPISTTTSSPKTIQVKCLVSGIYYQEGEKILGVGHSPCDNCYCIRGLIRCEPLSCAPPLLGCLPVIRPGECCASSYNCSGTIETRPEPNYGNFPIVSKEYAKLRKEVQKTDTNKLQNSTKNKLNNSNAYYIIAETPSTLNFKAHRLPSFSGTTRHFTDNRNFNASTQKPYFTNSTQNLSFNITETTMVSNQSEIVYKMKNNNFGIHNTTTNYKHQNNTYKRLVSTSKKPFHHQNVNSISIGNKEYAKGITTARNYSIGEVFEEKIDSQSQANKTDGNLSTEIIPDVDTALLEFIGNEDIVRTLEPTYLNFTDNENNEINTTFLFFNSTYQLNKEGQEYIKNKNEDLRSVELHIDTTELSISTDNFVTETVDVTSSITDYTTTELVTQQEIVTLKEIVNSTDCIKENKILNFLKNINSNEKSFLNKPAGPNSNEITVMPEDITIVDLESKVKVSTATLLPLQKLSPNILGATKDKDSYFDYDFQPTLPPSLPNLRIIPFLPSDALDSEKKQSENKIDYQLVQPMTESTIYTFTSLFSPPVETEGGFVPKEPPPMNNFDEIPSHTVVNEFNTVTSLSGMSITNQGKIDTDVCILENKEFRHNDPVPSINICLFCVCYFGEIVCQEPPCPSSNLECHNKPNILERLRCCQQIECGKESTTSILNPNTVTPGPEDLITVAEDINLPNPFRDEPAPNLQTLISDLQPYFLKKTTANIQQEQTTNITTVRPVTDIEYNSFKENLNRSKLKNEENKYSLDDVLEFLSSNRSQETFVSSIQENSTSILSTVIPSTDNIYEQNLSIHANKTSDLIKSTNNELMSPAVGLLKLAGCNIYGRMYRVGKIIFELSGPCLECKCTEIGVQCTPIC